MKNWEQYKNLFTKSLEQMVKDGYITVNKIIAIEGLGAGLANNLSTFEEQETKIRETEQMIGIMKKYFPKELEIFIKKKSK